MKLSALFLAVATIIISGATAAPTPEPQTGTWAYYPHSFFRCCHTRNPFTGTCYWKKEKEGCP